MANGMLGTTVTCVMSSVAEMFTAGSKTDADSESMWSRNIVMRWTINIMVPTMTNLTNSAPLKDGVIQERSKHSLAT
jgi:hypothetical protein